MQDDETRARVQAMYASVDFERLRQAIRKEIERKRLQLRDDRDLFAGTEATRFQAWTAPFTPRRPR